MKGGAGCTIQAAVSLSLQTQSSCETVIIRGWGCVYYFSSDGYWAQVLFGGTVIPWREVTCLSG